MGKRQRVVLYGNSLVLAGTAASLRAYPGIELICLDAQPPAAVQQLWALCPTVVILDLGAVPPEFPFSLLREQPDLVLIGVDAAGDKLLVLSGQQAHALTTEALVQVIEGRAHSPGRDSSL
jgi:DNA-binding NarL/FixJ family response regulator